MTLYLYKTGIAKPVVTIEHAVSYTADSVPTEDGQTYSPLAESFELSSLPDCSETLRADWLRDNPAVERRIEELEALMAQMLFGGDTE